MENSPNCKCQFTTESPWEWDIRELLNIYAPWHFSENSGEMKIFQSSVQNAIIQKYLSIPYQKRAGNLPAMKGNQLLPPMCIRGHLVVLHQTDRDHLRLQLGGGLNKISWASYPSTSIATCHSHLRWAASSLSWLLAASIFGWKELPVYSSRVKISMPSCQDQDDMAEKSGSEIPWRSIIPWENGWCLSRRQMPWIQWGEIAMEAKVCPLYRAFSCREACGL